LTPRPETRPSPTAGGGTSQTQAARLHDQPHQSPTGPDCSPTPCKPDDRVQTGTAPSRHPAARRGKPCDEQQINALANTRPECQACSNRAGAQLGARVQRTKRRMRTGRADDSARWSTRLSHFLYGTTTTRALALIYISGRKKKSARRCAGRPVTRQSVGKRRRCRGRPSAPVTRSGFLKTSAFRICGPCVSYGFGHRAVFLSLRCLASICWRRHRPPDKEDVHARNQEPQSKTSGGRGDSTCPGLRRGGRDRCPSLRSSFRDTLTSRHCLRIPSAYTGRWGQADNARIHRSKRQCGEDS
jgi:hypothetical protein